MERRLFHREPAEINGELVWFTKGRLGKQRRHHSFVRTSNLSLEGAKIHLSGTHDIATGAKARLQLGIISNDVRVLEANHTGSSTWLRVVYKEPSQQFIAYLEENLPVITEDRSRFEGKWV